MKIKRDKSQKYEFVPCGGADGSEIELFWEGFEFNLHHQCIFA